MQLLAFREGGSNNAYQGSFTRSVNCDGKSPCNLIGITGMFPRQALGTCRQLAAGYYTLRFAG
jgi:hypothetical protein